MPDRPKLGTCEECHKRFEYELVHNGVHNSSYAYCQRCGATALLDMTDSRFPVETSYPSAAGPVRLRATASAHASGSRVRHGRPARVVRGRWTSSPNARLAQRSSARRFRI